MAHLALHSFAETYRKGEFRNTIGSDEYAFNDPAFKIPGIMFSTHPYKEYHTSEDTPDKINYSVIERVQKAVLKTIDIYEKDFIPKKEFLGPLARSKYGIQTTNPQFNLSIDYLFYLMDGKRSLAELCAELGLAFDQIYELILRMETNGEVSRVDSSKEGKQKVTKQKRSKLSGSTDVSSKRRKVS
jgi:aminopeptidase-like protein